MKKDSEEPDGRRQRQASDRRLRHEDGNESHARDTSKNHSNTDVYATNPQLTQANSDFPDVFKRRFLTCRRCKSPVLRIYQLCNAEGTSIVPGGCLDAIDRRTKERI